MTEPLPTVQEDQELDLYSEQNPLSLVKLLHNCKEVLSAIEALPADLLEKSERELERQWKPNRDLTRLKIKFWEEYKRAQGKRSYMVMSNVFHGVCSRPYFYNSILPDHKALSWLITPPAEELIVQKELLQLGYKKIYKVFKLPFVETIWKRGKDGNLHEEKRVNVSLIKEVHSILKTLDERVNGAVVQRNLNVNVNPGGGGGGDHGASESLEAIESALKRIEKMQSQAKPEDVVEGEVEGG